MFILLLKKMVLKLSENGSVRNEKLTTVYHCGVIQKEHNHKSVLNSTKGDHPFVIFRLKFQ